MTPDYMIYPLIIGQATHIITALKTGYVILDFCFVIMLYLLYNYSHKLNLHNILYNYFKKNRTKRTIVLRSCDEVRSIKFRAIMHYVTTKNETIYKVREVVENATDYDTFKKFEKNSEYLVDQYKEFTLAPNIIGHITKESKEKIYGANKEQIDFMVLSIYSNTLSLYEIQSWINTNVKDYKKHLKYISNETQLYITAAKTSRTKNSDEGRPSSLQIEAVPWESTITFANSYFHKMDKVIEIIDFFLNNKSWYIEKGIPYNLGILLYGEPGCGKTRFIKQLMNYTGRHGIDIKLSDKINYQDLYNIIFKEEIDDEYIIPQDKRILIFEDIDAMGEAVKCRDKKNERKKQDNDNVLLNELRNGVAANNDNILLNNLSGPFSKIIATPDTDTNTNLSYLLNMLDGINECSGRIIIMTSNKPNELDKALIRPGRIDIKIHFDKCTRYDLMRMINLFWDKDFNENELLEELDMKYTSAELYNIFRSTTSFENIKKLFINQQSL